MSHLRGLYAITDGSDGIVEKSLAALAGGVLILQYRDKTGEPRRRLDEATRLRAACHEHGALFLVNDDVQLALVVGADGVHLGRTDMPLSTARALLGEDAVIGATCHDSLELADAAVAAGADYIAFGAFFPSPTKPDAVRAPVEILTRARALFDVPICAIGGIMLDNGAQLLAAGADMLAVSHGVYGADDIAAAATSYAALFP